MNGTDFAEGAAIAVDNQGNVYTTGYYSGRVDFNPGPDTAYLTAAGSAEVFIFKLNSIGEYVWAKAIHDESETAGLSIAVDSAGNVVISGTFSGTVDFDPGPGQDLQSASGARDGFVWKLDANGQHVWVKTLSGSNSETGRSLAVDADGNVFVTGYFNGTVDFDPGPATFPLSAAGEDDFFITKLDVNGELVWAKAIGGTSLERSNYIRLDGAGNLYLTGYFEGTADFDPGPGTGALTASGGSSAFIAKYNASGGYVWAKALSGNAETRGIAVGADAGGNVYTTGEFRGTVDFDPGPGTANQSSMGFADFFIVKLDSFGEFVWAKTFGGAFEDFASSLTLDPAGNVFTSGRFSGTVDFDPGPGTALLNSTAARTDIFVFKLTADGTYVWAHSMGGADADAGLAITLDGGENIYGTGYFGETVDFDPGPGTTRLVATGLLDVFIYKMSSGTTAITDESGPWRFIAYPNPSQGLLFLTVPETWIGQSLWLTNTFGQVVEMVMVTGLTVEMDMRKLPAGLYFVQGQTPQGSFSQKVVKQ